MTTSQSFPKIIGSNLFAQFSEQIVLAATPIIAVLYLMADASHTAWLQTIQTLPFLLFAIPAGIFVDKNSRRNIMILAELIRSFIIFVLILLFSTNTLTLTILMMLCFIAAIGTVFYNVAIPAYIPTFITKESFIKANRWLELVRSLAFSGGPALCGVIVANIGTPITYALALTFSILTVLLLYLLPKDIPTHNHLLQTSKWHQIHKEFEIGWKFIYTNDYLLPILLTATIFNTSWFMIQAIFVAYAIQELAFNTQTVGIILGLYGIGMLFGAWSTAFIAQKLSLGFMIILGPIGGFLGAMAILFTIWLPSPFLAAVGFFFLGFGPTIWAIMTLSLRQSITPINMLGKINALMLTATAGARPLGAIFAGVLAIFINIEYVLWLAALGFSLQLYIITHSKILSLKSLDSLNQIDAMPHSS